MSFHPATALLVIWTLFLINAGLALYAYRRMMRLDPPEVATALGAWLAGAVGAVLMSLGIRGGSLLHQLGLSIGAMVLMVGLVIGLQLCFAFRRREPPDEREPFVGEPVDPPAYAEPLPVFDRPAPTKVVDDYLESLDAKEEHLTV